MSISLVEDGLTGLEETRYSTVVWLALAFSLVSGLHGNPQSPLTEKQWWEVFLRSRAVNQSATLVLEARDQFCERPAEELAGIPLLLPIRLVFWP